MICFTQTKYFYYSYLCSTRKAGSGWATGDGWLKTTSAGLFPAAFFDVAACKKAIMVDDPSITSVSILNFREVDAVTYTENMKGKKI